MSPVVGCYVKYPNVYSNVYTDAELLAEDLSADYAEGSASVSFEGSRIERYDFNSED